MSSHIYTSELEHGWAEEGVHVDSQWQQPGVGCQGPRQVGRGILIGVEVVATTGHHGGTGQMTDTL